jgi:hypothetical protein
MNKMNRIIYFGLLIVLLLATGSCVSHFTPDLNKEDSKPFMVVEGQITDQEGPFSIKLTQSAPVSDTDKPLPVDHAEVNIIDDQGHSYHLYNYGSGIYTTRETNLKGFPGTTYTLMITTPEDGQQYTSAPVLMQDVPDIDSIYFQQVQHPRITEGKVYNENWVNILLDAHDEQGNVRYWRWQYEEVFQHVIGFNLSCWVTVSSSSILVASTAAMPVNELKGFIVRSFGPYNYELRTKYSILVKQYSTDVELYDYLKKLRDFNTTPGGIYNKIPIPIFGNITCCDGSRNALGYFTASSVKQKRFIISRADNYLMEIKKYEGPCTSWLPPPYW